MPAFFKFPSYRLSSIQEGCFPWLPSPWLPKSAMLAGGCFCLKTRICLLTAWRACQMEFGWYICSNCFSHRFSRVHSKSWRRFPARWFLLSRCAGGFTVWVYIILCQHDCTAHLTKVSSHFAIHYHRRIVHVASDKYGETHGLERIETGLSEEERSESQNNQSKGVPRVPTSLPTIRARSTERNF